MGGRDHCRELARVPHRRSSIRGERAVVLDVQTEVRDRGQQAEIPGRIAEGRVAEAAPEGEAEYLAAKRERERRGYRCLRGSDRTARTRTQQQSEQDEQGQKEP